MRIMEFADALNMTLEQASILMAHLEEDGMMYDFWDFFPADEPEDQPQQAAE